MPNFQVKFRIFYLFVWIAKIIRETFSCARISSLSRPSFFCPQFIVSVISCTHLNVKFVKIYSFIVIFSTYLAWKMVSTPLPLNKSLNHIYFQSDNFLITYVCWCWNRFWYGSGEIRNYTTGHKLTIYLIIIPGLALSALHFVVVGLTDSLRKTWYIFFLANSGRRRELVQLIDFSLMAVANENRYSTETRSCSCGRLYAHELSKMFDSS